jgi:hypothetical protein
VDFAIVAGLVLGAVCFVSMLFGMVVLAGIQTWADRREAKLGDFLDKGG